MTTVAGISYSGNRISAVVVEKNDLGVIRQVISTTIIIRRKKSPDEDLAKAFFELSSVFLQHRPKVVAVNRPLQSELPKAAAAGAELGEIRAIVVITARQSAAEVQELLRYNVWASIHGFAGKGVDPFKVVNDTLKLNTNEDDVLDAGVLALATLVTFKEKKADNYEGKKIDDQIKARWGSKRATGIE
jgi:Holliday junction resolvasome RuvABC endonuclease subunit